MDRDYLSARLLEEFQHSLGNKSLWARGNVPETPYGESKFRSSERMAIRESCVVVFWLAPSGLGGKVVIMVGAGDDVQCSGDIGNATAIMTHGVLCLRDGDDSST